MSWNATYRAQSYPSSMVAGSTATAWAEFNNTGTGAWYHGETYLGTQGPQDRSSPFCNLPNWASCSRPSRSGPVRSPQRPGRPLHVHPEGADDAGHVHREVQARSRRRDLVRSGDHLDDHGDLVDAAADDHAAPGSGQLSAPAGTATFTVAASGTGLSYQWQKNSANIANGGHYSGVTTTTLTVSSADASDAASYRCVVTNAGGSATSNAAALTVKAATTVTQQPAAQAVCAGATATFTVAATGDGTLSYQWQKDTVNITGATAATLQITNCGAGDVGSYRCVVTGGCGTATSNGRP